jgi:hypothetical protein
MITRSSGAALRETVPVPAATLGRVGAAGTTALGILAAISFCHFLNDMMQ